MKKCFPDAKQNKKYPKTTLCKEFTYVQKMEMKVMGILIPHQMMNLPFHDHIFMENLYLIWKLLKKG